MKNLKITKNVERLIIFSFGLLSGYFISNSILKNKYEELYQEEISSYRKFKGGYKKENIDNEKEYETTTNIDNSTMYDSNIITHDFNNEDIIDIKNKYYDVLHKNHLTEDPRIYIISPEDFADSEYECITLFYYTDGILSETDPMESIDGIIDNIEDVVPQDFEFHFGEYQDNIVYVRNEILQTDYEICKEDRPAYIKEENE